MKKLESIQIQNFKIFNEAVNIPIEGKHVLVWGVNGSGKSSIYWSLCTFLQCNAKSRKELKLLKSDLGEPEDNAENRALIGRLNTYRQRLFNFIISEKDNRVNPICELVDEINKIEDRVLNPRAHAGEAPFFTEEIEDAITKVKELKPKLDELKPIE